MVITPMEIDDWQLLSAYATRRSEEAFRTLVERYAGLAYHAAMSRCGSPDQAQEITQAVFIALAQKAGRIPRDTVLSGWIYQAARFAALSHARQETRRKRYEQEAAMSNPTPGPDETESIWDQLAPHLYEALDKLSKPDRDALLIRFFQNKSHRELAQALGVSENAAKTRVSRAVERLRLIFAKAGLATSSAALTSALSAHAAPTVPPGLTAAVTAAAMKSAPAGAGVSAAAWDPSKAAIFGGAAAVLAVIGVATITVKAVNTPVNNIAGQLEKQSGEVIVCENNLNLPVTFNIKGLSLTEALDRLATKAGAYWTVDYAIYKSSDALQKLEEDLRQAGPVESVGWTNLSHGPHTAAPAIIPHAPGMRFSIGLREQRMGHSDKVSMMVHLSPERSEKWMQGMHFDRPPGADAQDSEESQILNKAMKEGEAEGVLVPERLLAENALAPKISVASPVEATAENAAAIAKQAGASWVRIFTLRKSPLDGCGIVLIHAGMEDAYSHPKAGGRFDLSPDDRDAHEAAVAAYLQKKQSN